MPGRLSFIAGGREGRRGSVNRVLAAALSDAGDCPLVVVLGAANGDDPAFFRRVSDWLRDAGAGQIVAAGSTVTGDALAARRALAAANLVFVSGGDVQEGMRRLDACGLVPVLRELHRSGTSFCGLSAGSIMMAREWIRWPDPGNDAPAERFDCLSLTCIRIDTHGEADDWQELVALLALCPDGTRGFGLRSGSGIEANGRDAIRVVAGNIDLYVNSGGHVRHAGSLKQGDNA